MSRLVLLLLFAALVSGHGDHTFDLEDENDNNMPYAERHMHTEHHIDAFDLESFFKLHDLDMDGYWDVPEIEAVYGLHHHTIKEKNLPPAAVDSKVKAVVEKVLERLDVNKDGRISMKEFMDGGPDGLPSFEGYKDLGHHYDEESEFFLHHEELYHNTPETQVDEAYNHPEDIAHFQHHYELEAEEDAKERRFQGLPETADLTRDHVVEDPLEEHAHEAGQGPDGKGTPEPSYHAGDEVSAPSRLHRNDPEASPQRLQGAKLSASGWAEWKKARENGKGDDHNPRLADERLRSGVPYKNKFRKGLRADEF